MKWDTLVVCIVMITLKMFDVIAMNDLKARVEKLENKPASSINISPHHIPVRRAPSGPNGFLGQGPIN